MNPKFSFKILKNKDVDKIFELKKEIDFFIQDWFSLEKKLSVQTSGSTGVPKKIFIEKEKMRFSAQNTCDFLDLKKGNSALLCLPMPYISGKMMVVRAMERNLDLNVVFPSLTPLENLDFAIDFCAMTPLQVENSLSKLHLINKLIIGGAGVGENLIKKIHQNLPKNSTQKIYETYGMSETLSHIALREIFPKIESCFKTFPFVKISTDEENCLKISAKGLVDTPLQTNDIVEIVSEREFKFLARRDNVINSGGVKIFPEILENYLKNYLENDFIFSALEDEVLGQKLILIVEESSAEHKKNIVKKISSISFEKSFYKPKQIFFLDKLIRTPNGKIKRKETLEELKKNLL